MIEDFEVVIQLLEKSDKRITLRFRNVKKIHRFS